MKKDMKPKYTLGDIIHYVFIRSTTFSNPVRSFPSAYASNMILNTTIFKRIFSLTILLKISIIFSNWPVSPYALLYGHACNM